MIAEVAWRICGDGIKGRLCSQYDVCDLEDMKTFTALPDLHKHNAKFLKYFPLHFYNNELDNPPEKCKISLRDALYAPTPNILQAVLKLLSKPKLEFVEMSYLLHLVSDLHQPLHLTGFERGGLNRKLCSATTQECWSLHALWDAEILKSITAPTSFKKVNTRNIRKRLLLQFRKSNRLLCKIYKFNSEMSLEYYKTTFGPLAARIILEAGEMVAAVLAHTLEMSTFNSAADFDREISRKCKRRGKALIFRIKQVDSKCRFCR